MNILMVTNTYLPHVGGVAQSVNRFTQEFRRLGHRVVVVAPEFSGALETEFDVVRVPAIQNFNGSDFSVRLPIPSALLPALEGFTPDIVHSHHPFLLGDTAYRLARQFRVPLVFTHHTMYERYTHYVPGGSGDLKRFAIELSSGYANLCNCVIAPSESIAEILKERGVTTEIEAIPTGVDTEKFARGDGAAFRRLHGIGRSTFIIGHVGRLAPEKNLSFLADAVCAFLKSNPDSRFVVVGDGPSRKDIQRICKRHGTSGKLLLTGPLQGQELIDAYGAFDVFAFSSYSETQGMVVAEAMSAGIPVIALDAAGVREVVRDRENGFLLPVQDKQSFVKALKNFQQLSAAENKRFRRAARETGADFSVGNTADRLLAVYEKLKEQAPLPAEQDETAWESLLRNIEVETQIRGVALAAAGRTLRMSATSLFSLARRLNNARARFYRFVNRGEWTAKLLKLWMSTNTEHTPGLVMVQIDGLAKAQFEHALQQGRMPFLRKLLNTNGYHVHSLYSGLPSTTPSVQAELFYRKRMVVPAFAFIDPETKEFYRMLDACSASKIEDELRKDSPGLLEGGASYVNIYTGGAREANFTCSGAGWGMLAEAVHPWRILGVIVLHGWSIVRCFALGMVELLIAIIDCLSGILSRQDFFLELKFIPTRVLVTILMRELAVSGAIVDIARGIQVIHLNFLGYDEQAHRRGPSSFFAHWTLKGMDNAIERIWTATRRATRRDYALWVYSDHGQEDTDSYPELYGKSVDEAVNEVFGAAVTEKRKRRRERYRDGNQLQRAQWLGRSIFGKWPGAAGKKTTEEGKELCEVAALGPLGHIYPRQKVAKNDLPRLARALVEKAGIPLVLYADGKQVAGFSEETGKISLPADGEKLFTADHPFLDDVVKDLCDLCSHRYAGTFVISGYRRKNKPLSFPIELGAHAGPGPHETHAFVALPPEERVEKNKKFLYVRELHDRALDHLHGSAAQTAFPSSFTRRRAPNSVRIMTYNVHSCMGVDGKLSARRIAQVIAEFEPDIIALQELDVGRARTEFLDQAHSIARTLEMDFHFHPTVQVEEERFGNAILSALPMKFVNSVKLPQIAEFKAEPRGALWVEIDVDGQPLQVITTHLGLKRIERLQHAEVLLGEKWLGTARERGPVVVCGDLNASPRSEVYRQFGKHLEDVHPKIEKRRRSATWPGKFPLRRIDHVFVSENLKVQGAYVPLTHLTRVASDHLPVVVDLELVPADAAERAA